MARNKVSTFDQRVDWLVLHSDLWVDWFRPISHEPLEYYIGQRNPRSFIVRKMKDDGLFAPSTYVLDVKLRNELVAALKIIAVQRVHPKFE